MTRWLTAMSLTLVLGLAFDAPAYAQPKPEETKPGE